MTIIDSTDTPVTSDREWLPTDQSCPSWCNREHAQALAEGNGWEDSKEHQGHSFEYMLGGHRNPVDHRVMRAGGAKWILYPRVRPWARAGGRADEETVRLEVEDADYTASVTLKLTSGVARIMARQLLRLADQLDLDELHLTQRPPGTRDLGGRFHVPRFPLGSRRTWPRK